MLPSIFSCWKQFLLTLTQSSPENPDFPDFFPLLWTPLDLRHTSAKLIEIQQNFLQGRHGLQELGCQMESNDTLHGSELVPHWVLGPKKSNLVPWGQKKFAQKFLYTKLVRYHEVILWGFEAKIVFGAKQASN